MLLLDRDQILVELGMSKMHGYNLHSQDKRIVPSLGVLWGKPLSYTSKGTYFMTGFIFW